MVCAVQVQSPGGCVGETVHRRDSEPSIALTLGHKCPTGKNTVGELSVGVKQHESPFPIILPCRSSLFWPSTQDPAPQDPIRPAVIPL